MKVAFFKGTKLCVQKSPANLVDSHQESAICKQYLHNL